MRMNTSRAINPDVKERCYQKLIDVARAGKKITYGELCEYLGIRNIINGLTPYLDAICDDEKADGRPDITVVVVRKSTGFGQFQSSGPIDPKDADHVRAYEAELVRVHRQWVGR